VGLTVDSHEYAKLDSVFTALCLRGFHCGNRGKAASVITGKIRRQSFRLRPAGRGGAAEMRISHKYVRGNSWPDFPEMEFSGEYAVDLATPWSGNRDATKDKEQQDHELIRKGESLEEIILTLYNEYRPRLYRYMRSLQVGQDHAEEIIQETFLRLSIELFRKGKFENIQGWIVRVSHNLAINVLKKDGGSVVNEKVRALLMANQSDSALSPEDAYLKKEQERIMKTVFSSLKPQHRQCFQMRAQGLPYKEIGLAFGFSEQRAAFLVKQVAVRLAAACGLEDGEQGEV